MLNSNRVDRMVLCAVLFGCFAGWSTVHGKDRGLTISMTEITHCYENAMAERINGILKQEYEMDRTFKTKAQAKKAFEQAVWLYNNRRPHGSLDNRAGTTSRWPSRGVHQRWEERSNPTGERQRRAHFVATDDIAHIRAVAGRPLRISDRPREYQRRASRGEYTARRIARSPPSCAINRSIICTQVR